MVNKTRDISPYDYLQALQQEFICLEIRSKIYVHRSDKEYFANLMDKKSSAIKVLSKKNRLQNIIDHDEEYLKVWTTIVPPFGFPKLIYNIVNVTEKQLQFFYRGSVLKVNGKEEYGISENVNFDKGIVSVLITGDKLTTEFKVDKLTRLNHQETDEYYYYLPNNVFNCDHFGAGMLERYDMKNKNAQIRIKSGNDSLILHRDKITRIL